MTELPVGGPGADWDSPYPYDLIHLDPEDLDEWKTLRLTLGRETNLDPDNPDDLRTLGLAVEREESLDEVPRTDRPLWRCLDVARENKARSVVIESRYIDIDYRSEFSAFYSKAFARFHDSCRRLHFFSCDLEYADISHLTDIQRKAYLGYIVLRPQVKELVGRTMLRPPPDLARGVRTAVRETVGFFGQELEVRAVPFMQQDSRVGSCAHVAVWMCHYTAHRGEQRLGRLPLAHFSHATDSRLGVGRLLPSSGMTIDQISDVLSRSGLSPMYYEIGMLSDEDRPKGENWLRIRGDHAEQATRVCCRYANSGVPVIAIVRHTTRRGRGRFTNAPLHAILVCGYMRDEDATVLIGHDDRRGPYLEYRDLDDEFDEAWGESARWDYLFAPLPEKVWLSGEAAERTGSEYLIGLARASGVPAAEAVAAAFDRGDVSFRSFAINSKTFKKRFAANVGDPLAVEAYRIARFPHYVWVIEALDREARRNNLEECVLGEIVLDATSDVREPHALAARLPGICFVERPDAPGWNHQLSLTGLVRSCSQLGQVREEQPSGGR